MTSSLHSHFLLNKTCKMKYHSIGLTFENLTLPPKVPFFYLCLNKFPTIFILLIFFKSTNQFYMKLPQCNYNCIIHTLCIDKPPVVNAYYSHYCLLRLLFTPTIFYSTFLLSDFSIGHSSLQYLGMEQNSTSPN